MWYSPTEWFGEDGSRVYVNEAGQIVDPSADGSMPGYCFPVQDYFSNVTSTSIPATNSCIHHFGSGFHALSSTPSQQYSRG